MRERVCEHVSVVQVVALTAREYGGRRLCVGFRVRV